MSNDLAINLDFQQIVVHQVPDHRKPAWIERCLTKEALVTHILPFILREGINFPCVIMQELRISDNRQKQIDHQKDCNSCSMLSATDFHPLKVRIPQYLIWQAVYRGALELWDTRNLTSPTFNSLIMLNRNEKPDDCGAHLIITGRGRHNSVDCQSLVEMGLSVGSTQAFLTIFMRIISTVTQIKGRAWLGPNDFRPHANILLSALCNETDYRLSKMLEKTALQLSPLLREVPIKFRREESDCFINFKMKYYGQNTYQFEYCNCNGNGCQMNHHLDLAGVFLLQLLSKISSLGLDLSLCEVMGHQFAEDFTIRNLTSYEDGFRLSPVLNQGELFFRDNLVF